MMDESEAITKASVSQNSGRKKSKNKKSFDFVKIKSPVRIKPLNLDTEENLDQTQEVFSKSKFTELAKDAMRDQTLYPPPMDVYVPKIIVAHDTVSFGLNMYFKKAHKFSMDPN